MRSMDVDGETRAAALRIAIAGLEEDASSNDVTTASLGSSASGRATLVALSRKGCVVAGWFCVEETFGVLGPAETCRGAAEGETVPAGGCIGKVSGRASLLLGGERVALNLLGRLCGVASLTRRFVDAVAGTGTEILDTRKTTPGFRLLERHAVRCGGGTNHRFDLSAMALYKDNHLVLAGGPRGLREAVRDIRGRGLPVEIEAEDMDQVKEALDLGPDRILLDNMAPVLAGECARLCLQRGVYAEASGGICLDNVRAYAEAGVSGISIGALTHSAPAADISFEMELG